jgi:two-component system cell cycle sensor histidine kinase/response regulator CckA
MDEGTPNHRIEVARQHLQALKQLVDEPSPDQQALLAEITATLEDFSTSVIGQKLAEGARPTGKQELCSAVDVMPIPAVITRAADGTILHANEEYGKILGVPMCELVGRRITDYYGSADNRCTVLERLAQDGRLEGYEVEGKKGDGSFFSVIVSAELLACDGEQVILTAFQDITGRKTAEAEHERLLAVAKQQRRRVERVVGALQEERDTLEVIMESTEAQLAYLDAEFNFLRVNSAYAQGSGYSKEQLIGHNHFELFPHAENQAIFEQVRDSGEAVTFHAKPFVYPGQPERKITYWDWTLIPIKDQTGKTRALVLSLLDVTQWERSAEEQQRYGERLQEKVDRRTVALQASEERFRAIFEQAGVGVALGDEEGRLIQANPAYCRIVGCSPDEAAGVFFTEYTHPDDREAEMVLFRELMAGTRDYYTIQKRYVRKDGQACWGALTVTPARGPDGRPRFAIRMLDDITEQKQTMTALMQAEKLAVAGRLAASLAHEINNPLQSVIGCIGLAQEALEEGEDISQYLQVGLDELRRAADVVAGLRNLYREPDPLERKPTDLNNLLGQVLILARRRGEEHRVEVRYEASVDLPPVTLAPDRIEQVFLNLILNAIDAMPDGGELYVGVAPAKDRDGVCISFSDCGVGIAPDVMPHLFDPFFTTRPDGLGLGLFISQNIVKEHGGHIEVDSKVGEGTTFRVWLPA